MKNIYNQEFYLPKGAVHYPGFKFYPYLLLKYNGIVNKYIGQFLPLKLIPLNFPISFLYNTSNTNSSYIRSSGSTGYRKNILKKTKLIHILLPSNILKLYPVSTLALFSKNNDLFKNKILEGGWGYSINSKKITHVRGVAKNPVDHPNGGRTKAKQPELSPWGWIAKHNK